MPRISVVVPIFNVEAYLEACLESLAAQTVGDFEAVLSWGAGLTRESCLRTLELSNPSRLVVDVQTP